MRFDICALTNSTVSLSHEDLLSHIQALEGLGYGGVWFNEFHFKNHIAYPSTLILASAIFARTERIRVGTSVIVPALYHPLMLAEFIAQLCRQSGNRLDVGLGRASNIKTMRAFGYEREEATGAFKLALDIMRASWRGEVEVPASAYWRTGKAAVGPLHKGDEPPLYIGGKSMDTCLFAAEQGLPLLLATQFPDDDVMEAYAARLPNRTTMRDISFSRFVCVAPTHAQAMADVDALIEDIYREEIEHNRKLGRDITLVARQDRATFMAERAIVGTPDACIDQINALDARFGFGQIRLMFGDARSARREPSPATELFARAVMPSFAGA